VSFASITLCVASQRVFIVVIYFVMTQSGNFWIHPRNSLHRFTFKEIEIIICDSSIWHHNVFNMNTCLMQSHFEM
jgi:hypothetical protein